LHRSQEAIGQEIRGIGRSRAKRDAGQSSSVSLGGLTELSSAPRTVAIKISKVRRDFRIRWLTNLS
jgi:hypothetical protein